MKPTSPLRASAALLLTSLLLSLTTAQSLDSGLKIETTKPASCQRKSQVGDKLNVHYRGTLQSDGTEFDSSYSRGQPFQFVLGQGQVIKGWDEGLLDMCPGEGRKLTIPPEMAYKDRDMGKIPPNSVLVFETELLGIEGIEKEIPPPAVADSSPVPTPTSDSDTKYSGNPHSIHNDHGQQDAAKGSSEGPHKSKSGKGECKLLGRFAILIQGALGALALLALVWKRWRETPRRPVKIWFFDVSKQVVGSFLLHFANLFLSMLSSGSLEITNKASNISPRSGDKKKHPNPCSFYLLNLAIDTTIGIPILVLFLRILHALFQRTPLANPPESLKSGNYGHPPKWRWWGKQALVYFLGLFGMKLVVFLLFQLFPWLGWVGDWALRWTEGKEWMQITFVMLIFPLIMNAAQYWIIDSFIKDKVGDYDYAAVENGRDGHDSDAASENEGLIGGRGRDSEEEGSRPVRRISPQGGRVVAEGEARTKEANPLPLPVEFESDEEDEHPNSRRHRD